MDIKVKGADVENHSNACTKVVRKMSSSVMYEVFFDKKSGLIGPGLRNGKKLFDCSEHDRIVIIWRDGWCAAISPKRKRKLERGVIKVFKFDIRRRYDKHFFCAYTNPSYGFSYLRIFSCRAFAKDGHRYSYLSPNAKALFVEDYPPTIYIKYAISENKKIRQQVCKVLPSDATMFEMDNGWFRERLKKSYSFAHIQENILTTNHIECVSLSVPDWWDNNEALQRSSKETLKSGMRLDYE